MCEFILWFKGLWDTFASTALGPIIGAFAGAISAYYVSQFNERKKRHRERWKEHRNGLVRLGLLLNEILAITFDNRFIANKLITDKIRGSGITLVWKNLHTFPRDESIYSSLLRLKIVNELISYNHSIRKFNNDIDSMWEAYSQMRNARLRGDINKEQYLISLDEFRAGLGTFVAYFDLIDEETINLLSRTRVAIKQDERYDRKYFRKLPTLANISKEMVSQERIVLEQECKTVKAKSKEKISKYLGNS